MSDKTVTKFKTNETETIFIYITTAIKTDPPKSGRIFVHIISN